MNPGATGQCEDMRGKEMKNSKYWPSLLLVAGGIAVLLLSLQVRMPSVQAMDGPMPSALPRYRITDLGTLGGRSSWAYSINNVGQVVGESRRAGSEAQHGFLWQDGVMTDLDAGNGRASYARAINNLGDVVGFYEKNGYLRAGVWYYHSQLIDIGTLNSDRESYAYDISDDGVVVGYSHTDTNSDHEHGFWVVPGGVVHDFNLQVSPGWGWEIRRSYAYHENGQYLIYGCRSDCYESASFILDHDVLTDLGSLYNGGTVALDINASGQVVGYSPSIIGYRHAFLWQNGTMTDLGALRGNRSWAAAINDVGQVVGDSHIDSGEAIHAVLWEHGKMTDLNTLIPPNSGWVLYSARDINKDGQIVGYGDSGGADVHAFLLTPLLQPSAFPTPQISILPTHELLPAATSLP